MERALRTLRALRTQGRPAFTSDEAVQDRADRNAQLLAQGCADIALHIVAASGAPAPDTYADALVRLGAMNVITPDLADRLAAAVRLRNILVHGYLDVDHGRLYDELDWIEDTARFAISIDAWLAAQGSP